MNVFKELVLSVYDFKSYKKFLDNKGAKTFLAGVILMVFYFILTIVVPFAQFQVSTGGLAKLAEDYIPDFKLSGGTLWVEEPFELENDGMYISVDTSPDTVFYGADEIGEYISEYYQVILADSEKFIIKDKGQIQEMYFSDLGMDFSKQQLLAFIPSAYAILAGVLVLIFIFMTGLFFFGVLFVALLGMIAASCMKYQLTFGQLYKLGIYSRTLPILIKSLVSFLPFSIPMFAIVNFGLSVLYIVFAIRGMKEQELQAPMEFRSEQDDYFRS